MTCFKICCTISKVCAY